MSQAGRERDPGEGASLEAMVDVVGYLRAELQSIREREQRREGRTAAFGPDAAPKAAPLDPPVQVQLDRLESALAEGLAAIPDGGGQLAEREELARLTEQLDGLRTSMIDRFDAIQLPDLRPVVEHLERVHQQIGALPIPDLHPVRERIEQLHHEIQALTPPDLEPVRARLDQLHQQIADLPRADQVVGALAPQLDAVRDALRPDGVLEAIDAMASSLRAQATGIGALAPQVRQAIEPLGARLDRLVESDSAARNDLVLATEVLVGLTQLTEASEQHLNELLSGQEAALLEQRALVVSAVTDLSHTLTEQVQGLESQLGTLVARITAIEDNVSAHLQSVATRIEAGLGAQLRERLGELGLTQLHASVAAIGQRLDDADGGGPAVLDAVHALEARLSELGLGQLPTTVTGLGQQVGAVRSDSRMLVEAVRGLEARLDDLDPAPLSATVSDLAQQVAAGRTDNRVVTEALRALDARVGDLDTRGLAPVRTAIDGLRSQLEALPAPDLGRVEAALARITAAVASERRVEPATAEDLGTLGHSISEAIEAVAQLLAQQAEETAALAEHVQSAPPSERGAAEGGDPGGELRATLDQVVAELAEVRHAVERRGGSRRWRRSGSDDPRAVDAEVAGSSEIEQRVEQALVAMDERLATLSRQVERTAGHAIQAASAATAALEGVTAAKTASETSAQARRTRSLRPWVDRPGTDPAPSASGANPGAPKKAPAKKAPAKKAAGAKKAPAKNAPAKKAAATEMPAASEPPVTATASLPPPPPPPPPVA